MESAALWHLPFTHDFSRFMPVGAAIKRQKSCYRWQHGLSNPIIACCSRGLGVSTYDTFKQLPNKTAFLISVFSCSVKALWHGFFHSEIFSLWPEVWDNGPPCALPLGKVPRQNVLPLKKANLQELKKSDASFVVSYNQTCSTLAPIFTTFNKKNPSK